MVPLAVAAGILLASGLEYARGTIQLGRVFVRLGDSWYAVGPALVLGLAGESQPDLRSWPIYVAALGAQFALDYGSTLVRQWATLGVSPRLHLRTMGSVYVIDAGLAPVGLAVAFASTRSSAGVLLALPLVALLAVFARERRVRIDHELELRDAYRGTAFLLGDVVEADDAYTGEHSKDVVELTLAVADELGLSSSERRDAEFAALLHDVGKVRVPNEIINKPGKLTPEERKIVEKHTVDGEQMLLRVGGLLADVGRIVRACHERWDGDGYPDGIAGENIPLIARIVAACDAYNAMTSDRSYRKALPVSEAVAELEREAGASSTRASWMRCSRRSYATPRKPPSARRPARRPGLRPSASRRSASRSAARESAGPRALRLHPPGSRRGRGRRPARVPSPRAGASRRP